MAEQQNLLRSTAGITTRSALAPEFFQESLASAFVVQEGLMDVQLPSAVLTVRRLIVEGQIDVNGAMHLIAGRTRNVANATGAAIGLLEGDQLVYRAGSGSAATLIGRHVAAALSVSPKVEPKDEILRVEDAETNAGIGGAICHQFGAKSLLILPIYHEHELGGVLQVFFDEAHVFQDGELCAYQSLASAVGEVITQATQVELKKSAAVELSTMPAIEQTTPLMQGFLSNGGSSPNSHAIWQAGGAAIAESERLPSSRARPAAAMITHRAKVVPLHIRMRKVVDLAAVVIVLVVASWIVYTDRRPALAPRVVAHQRSNTIKHQVPFVPTELRSTNRDVSTPQTASVSMKNAREAAGNTPRRVRIGDDEIDYISEDVTVRHFTHRPAPQQQALLGGDQVEYVSEDVTVRRFASKPAVVPLR